jgi:PAS domain S-box-containing protein
LKILIESLEGKSVALEHATILVVEDNPVESQLASKILRNAGFTVFAVDCGDQVLDAVVDYQPDLILLDALLPDIDGFDVCEQLRAHPKGVFIPIVMLTGLDDMVSINRAYDAGASDFFTKPVNNSILVHRIRYLLRARQILDELRMSKHSLSSAQRAAKMGHWEYDLEKECFGFSEEANRLYFLSDEDDLSDVLLLTRRCHADDKENLRARFDACMENQKDTRIEHRIIGIQGEVRYLEVHMSVIKDQGGDSTHILGLSIDITERKESEQEILRLAYCDRLTNLPNRYLLELYLDQAIPSAHLKGKAVSILGIDLDLFNRINNAMGHNAGDAVLSQLSERLLGLLDCKSVSVYLNRLSLPSLLGDKATEMVARLAADTFVILLPAVDRGSSAVEAFAQKVKESFQQPFNYRGQELFVTASIGITYSDSGSSAATTLLQHADLAMHEAKSQGRNIVVNYNGDLVSKVSTHLAIQGDLRKALKNDEFQLFYQPKISPTDGSIKGFEALVRWMHPEKGSIPPDHFITIAEETGQIVELGQWVLETACRQNQQWISTGLIDVRVAVNVAARQFKEGNLVNVVESALRDSGLSERNLELEITESVLISDSETSDHMASLRKRGITIALDDFGTGYSSLSYLTQFPIDTIKIDRSFVCDITRGSDKAAIVSAVTYLAHDLGYKVVAEGVETEAELSLIKQLKCDEVQGYYYCRPMAAADIEVWLRSRIAENAVLSRTAK